VSSPLVGDALWGDPAGSLRLPDDKLSDPPAAVLSLRKLRAHRPRHLLVGHGASIFNTGFETLTECLEARTDAYVQRVNVDELEFAFMDFGVSRDAPPYNGGWAEIGFLLGATKLGYAATRLEPGQVSEGPGRRASDQNPFQSSGEVPPPWLLPSRRSAGHLLNAFVIRRQRSARFLADLL
jgi:hypothetical protein